MSSAFNNMCKNIRDRNWGGTSNQIACEPYISGYSFMKFLHVPEDLKEVMITEYLGTNSQDSTLSKYNHVTLAANDSRGNRGVADMLEHAMNSFTPPGGTINPIEIPALGGMKWTTPGSMDYGDSLSIKYLEFSGLPITRIHRAWFNMIRDNRMGTTHMSNTGRAQAYNKQSYAATIAYWTTKPDAKTVEFAAIYTGVFPTKDPMDLFSGDITSNDKLDIEIEYNVDMIYNDSKVFDKCQELANASPNGGVSGTSWCGYTGNWGDVARRGFAEHETATYQDV